jgi:hypothetical protein
VLLIITFSFHNYTVIYTMKPSLNSLLLALFAVSVGRGGAFLYMPTIALRSAAAAPRTFLQMSVLDQQPHESDSAYMRRLMEVASDSASFEKAVMAGDSYDHELVATAKHSNGYKRADDNDSSLPTKKKKGTYQRAEEWDAERKANGTMTWEEKVQWEGQRHGNRVNQNDILRHHLNTF